LGIGDWAQSPIPNPQSPIPNPQSPLILLNKIKLDKIIITIKINNHKLISYKFNNLKIHKDKDEIIANLININ
jgi:hypothetical protein